MSQIPNQASQLNAHWITDVIVHTFAGTMLNSDDSGTVYIGKLASIPL